jgi:PAS domain S-box-containing protein
MVDPFRILHVDDSDPVDVAATVLERRDDHVAVETVTSSTDGLARLDDGDVDCVVSGREMPDGTGAELLEAVREQHPDLPFVLLPDEGSERTVSGTISTAADVGDLEECAFVGRALDALDDIFYVVGLDGHLHGWNDRLPEVTGYDAEEVADLEMAALFPEGERDRVSAAIEEAKATGSVVLESELVTADGVRVPYELAGSRFTDSAGDPAGVVGICRDITERKEHARERELRYEAIFNQTYQFTGLLDPDGTLLEANETALEFGGLDREDVIGKPFWEAHWWQIDEETKGELRDAIDRASEGEFVRYDVEVQGDDRTVTIDFSIRPVTDDDGNVAYLIPEGRNITERKALQQRERELERQNDRLDRFVSVVSHDLRNPLNVAQGRLKLAREECDCDHLEDAADAVDRSLTLIEDLLTLTREGEQAREMESVDLTEAVDGCWRNVATADSTLAVDTELTVRADPSRLKQLLENLFRNAVEHGGDGVTVTVGSFDDGFYVADDGPGIPEEEHDRVFETGYSTAEEGTGFGLNIVRQIARAHGWDVSVGESRNGGARFEVGGVDTVSK